MAGTDDIELTAKLVTRISQKTGKPYQAVEIELVADYKKLVFLDKSEIKLVELANS